MSHKAVHDKKTISLCDDNTIIKADLAYFDDNGRKIMDTVWLDVPGYGMEITYSCTHGRTVMVCF